MMNLMKKRPLKDFLPVSTMIFAMLPVVALGQVQEKSYSVELTNPEQPMQLDVDMRNGSIVVQGYDGKTVEISAVLTPLTAEELREKKKKHRYPGWNQKQNKPLRNTEGLQPVQNVSLNLEIEERNNQVEIDSEQSSYRVDLVVQVPRNAEVEVEMYDGNKVEVIDISASVEVETWRGDIIASGINGPIVAETHMNDIVIDFDTLSQQSPTSFTTHAGDIDITLPNSVDATLQVQNYQGQILSGLAAEFAPVDSIEQDQQGRTQQIKIGAHLEAKLNGGGQKLSISTYSGNVYLRNKG